MIKELNEEQQAYRRKRLFSTDRTDELLEKYFLPEQAMALAAELASLCVNLERELNLKNDAWVHCLNALTVAERELKKLKGEP